MEQIKLLIVEDEPIIAADLKRAMKKMGYAVMETLESGEEALEFIKETPPDLVLMDIQLEGDLDGIDTAHEISKIQPLPIIYLTSNTDPRTFNRAKLTQPYGFLSKPFRLTDIKHSIDLAFQDQEEEPVESGEKESRSYQMNDRIFVRSREHLVKIKLEDIIYVEADSCYCNIYTKEEKHVIVSTLKKFEASVSFPSFIRVHRSFLINVQHVDKIGDSYVMFGEQMVPVSKNHKENFLAMIPRF